jgi:hypothetical protein
LEACLYAEGKPSSDENIPVAKTPGGKSHVRGRLTEEPRRCYLELPSHHEVSGDSMSTEGTGTGQDDQPDAAAPKDGKAAPPKTDPQVATAEETEDVDDTPVDTTEPS